MRLSCVLKSYSQKSFVNAGTFFCAINMLLSSRVTKFGLCSHVLLWAMKSC